MSSEIAASADELASRPATPAPIALLMLILVSSSQDKGRHRALAAHAGDRAQGNLHAVDRDHGLAVDLLDGGGRALDRTGWLDRRGGTVRARDRQGVGSTVGLLCPALVLAVPGEALRPRAVGREQAAPDRLARAVEHAGRQGGRG